MKTKIIISTFALAICFTATAQGTYAGFGASYGLPVGGNVLGYISSENMVYNTSIVENVKGSFGSGFTIGSYFGYMFNENMGFEIGVNYLWGKKYNFSNKTDYGNGTYSNSTDEVSASSFRISPEVRMGFGDGKFRPYLKGGMTVGLFNKIVDSYTENAKSPMNIGEDITEKRFELTKGNSVGITGAFGVNYSINGTVFVFAELTSYLVNWSPLKGEFTKATFNGTDQLGSMTISQKQFEFKNTVDDSMNTDVNSPTLTLKKYFPMSSFGFSIGMHFAFGK